MVGLDGWMVCFQAMVLKFIQNDFLWRISGEAFVKTCFKSKCTLTKCRDFSIFRRQF